MVWEVRRKWGRNSGEKEGGNSGGEKRVGTQEKRARGTRKKSGWELWRIGDRNSGVNGVGSQEKMG